MQVELQNILPGSMFWGNNGKPRELPPPPHEITNTRICGDVNFGRGQRSVQINGVIWLNETYIK